MALLLILLLFKKKSVFASCYLYFLVVCFQALFLINYFSKKVMSHIFNEESAAALTSLRHLAKAIANVSSSTSAGLKENDTVFTLSRSLPEVTAAIREVGTKLSQLLHVFEASVTEQLVNFYRSMKVKVDEEHNVLRATKSLMPSDPSLLKHLVSTTQEDLHNALAVVQGRSHTPRLSTSQNGAPSASTTRLSMAAVSAPHGFATSASPALPYLKSPRRSGSPQHATFVVPSSLPAAPPQNACGKDATAVSAETLRMWLYLTLQSTMQLCEASRGAIYLKASEGTAYLSRVCGLNAEDRLPLDVSPAAGSTIATVVQNCVGVNIGRSRNKNPNALDNYSSASQAVRASIAIKINNGVILPIGDIGCVLIADKTTESFFSELDEHIVWSACMMVRGVLRRYSLELVAGKPTQAIVNALNLSALLPPITSLDDAATADGAAAATAAKSSAAVSSSDTPRKQAAGKDAARFMSPEEELQNLLPGIMRIPRLPKKLVMVRASEYNGFQQILSKDVEALKKIELSDEDLLEAAVPYISNLEALWKKAIDSMTELRSTCERLDREVAARNSRIIELEVEHRVLSRNLNTMRNDVQRIRSAIPSHLQDLLGNSPSSPTGAPQSSASQPNFTKALTRGEARFTSFRKTLGDRSAGPSSPTTALPPQPPTGVPSSSTLKRSSSDRIIPPPSAR